MAERGGLEPDEPPAPPPARHRPDRDPVALAAWRRVAEQRSRRGRDDDVVAEPVTHRHAEPDTPPWGVEPPVPPAPAAPARAEPPPAPGGPGPRPGGSGPPPTPTRHDVLLGLAGRIDDDALASVRELVAVEEDAGAAELLAGCLLAAEVGITEPERAVLAPWFAATRVDAELLGRLPSDLEATTRASHRFVDAVGPGAGDTAGGSDGSDDDADALAHAAARLPGVTGVRQCWRVTPAGAAPGPVPHRVVLVETASVQDCEPVAHHMAHAAREVGATSVEVFPAGAVLPAYHAAAVEVSVPVAGATTAERFAPVDGPNWRAVDPDGAPGDDGERWRTVAAAGPDVVDPAVESSVPAGPAVRHDDAEPALPTLDYGSTADRIAALWSTPAPVDGFSASPGTGALEASVLEHDDQPATTADLRGLRDGADRDDAAEPPATEGAPVPQGATAAVADGGDAATERTTTGGARGPDAAGPPEQDAATALTPTALAPTAPTPAGQEPAAVTPAGLTPAGQEPAAVTPAGQEPAAVTPAGLTPAGQEPAAVTPGQAGQEPAAVTPAGQEPAGPGGPSATQVVGASGEPGAQTDDGRVQRARSSRAGTDDDDAPAFGHDARYGAAGTGPAWPGGAGGPVPPGGSPHDGLLVPSPVEIGQEPIDLGGRTNGHHVGAANGAHHGEEPGGGATDPTTDPVGWSPEASSTASEAWSPDTEEAVAQLSDRERALLARLHEELASRERAEGWETPAAEQSPPGHPSPGDDRRPGPGGDERRPGPGAGDERRPGTGADGRRPGPAAGDDRRPGPPMRPFAVPPFPADGPRPPAPPRPATSGPDPDAVTGETPWPPPRRTARPTNGGRNGHGLNGHAPHRDDEGDDDTDDGTRR